jgi:hypothetical protein
MNEQNEFYPYIGILFTEKNETLTCITTWMNLERTIAKVNEAITKELILYNPIHMKCPK